MTEIFEYDFDKKNIKPRELVKSTFNSSSLKFYDSLDVVDKRKYFVYLQRTNNPLPPDIWYIQKEYKRYEYSFGEIASILKLTKQEVINTYESAMQKLRIMIF